MYGLVGAPGALITSVFSVPLVCTPPVAAPAGKRMDTVSKKGVTTTYSSLAG